MKTRIQKFEGAPVDGATLKVTGALGERVGQLARGEEVFVILRAVVTDVNHGIRGELLLRQHKAATVVAAMLEPDQGARLLEEALTLADERFGIRDLFHTDE